MGPLRSDEAPQARVVFARRFRCRRCGAVITVVPDAVAPRRRYAAPAIALALTLFGVAGRAAKDVQARVGVGGDQGLDDRRWRMLDRWPVAILTGELFERVRAPAPEERSTKRSAAAFISHHLAALSRLIVGPVDMLAMDGALMAIVPGSAGESRPPSRSTPQGGPAIA